MPAALWIGETEPLYFRDALNALVSQGPVLTTDALSSAISTSDANDVALIVVAERFPGEWSPSQFDELRRRFPTLPIVRLCGPWCEGELRSRVPPPSWRLPWYRAATEFALEAARIARGDCPTWGRPVTETEEERLANAPIMPVERAASQRVGVLSARPANAAWLLDAIRAVGAMPVQLEKLRDVEASDVEVLLWDLVGPQEAIELPAATASPLTRRGVALADFPRHELIHILRQQGFATVLAKPCRLEDLAWAIRNY